MTTDAFILTAEAFIRSIGDIEFFKDPPDVPDPGWVVHETLAAARAACPWHHFFARSPRDMSQTFDLALRAAWNNPDSPDHTAIRKLCSSAGASAHSKVLHCLGIDEDNQPYWTSPDVTDYVVRTFFLRVEMLALGHHPDVMPYVDSMALQLRAWRMGWGVLEHRDDGTPSGTLHVFRRP